MKKGVNNKSLTYISLFSSAGIGCYGFKQEGFKCIATCELIEKRLNIQKANNKCDFSSGYISGDLTLQTNQEKIFREIEYWKKHRKIESVDVVIATPPCQGMSVANQKKKNELNRNSLVVAAISIIKKVKPKIFIFENVSRFLKTTCTGLDGNNRTIKEEIEKELLSCYCFSSKVLNFKNYGSNSSRTRTLVIGVRKEFLNLWSPFELFPDYQKEKTLHEVIGNFKSLKKMGEIDNSNILHHFKEYDVKMLSWIKNIKQGESAFENKNIKNIPHKTVNGKIIKYVDTFGDKYKRQCWDKVAPCIHTANDCLASQNTIHPVDNRVFSIAELMEMMTIPKNFKWDFLDLDNLDMEQKKIWLKKNQLNIRKCIGEAVPTNIFRQIAMNIKKVANNNIYDTIKKYEYLNPNKEINAAYFTDKSLISYIYNLLPEFNQEEEINILEPSVGSGSFLLPIFKKYQHIKKVNLFLNDISQTMLQNTKKIIKKMQVPKNFFIHYLNQNFKYFDKNRSFDLIIGNPPFKKDGSKNLFEIFWEKSFLLGNNIIFINPKYILQSSNYFDIRNKILGSNKKVSHIVDFGEMGFKDAKIETIVLGLTNRNIQDINIFSIPKNLIIKQRPNYIFDKRLPYWIIYRNENFDKVYFKMKQDIFKIQKNYEISNEKMNLCNKEGNFWVIRSKNIDINEPKTIKIKNYDRYINERIAKATKFYKYIKSSNQELFLIPTLTYYPRMIRMPKDTFVNGSVLVAELKDPHIVISDNDIKYYYSKEFRDFYSVAFNFSTRTLNVDKNTIKFFGIIR